MNCNKKGRPSKYTEVLTLEIIHYLSDGVPFKYACNLAGIGESTGYGWLQKHETFRSQVAVARSKAIQKLIKLVESSPGGAWKLLKCIARDEFRDTWDINLSSELKPQNDIFTKEQLKKAAQTYIETNSN